MQDIGARKNHRKGVSTLTTTEKIEVTAKLEATARAIQVPSDHWSVGDMKVSDLVGTADDDRFNVSSR